MDPLPVAHLMALGIWLGIVTTEVLFEFSGSDADSLRAAALAIGLVHFRG